MNLELTDEETAALTRHLRPALDYDAYPLAPWVDPLKAILAKLDPPKPQARTLATAETRHGEDGGGGDRSFGKAREIAGAQPTGDGPRGSRSHCKRKNKRKGPIRCQHAR